MLQTGLRIRTRVQRTNGSRRALICVSGEIDVFNSARLRSAIARQIDAGANDVAVDLSSVDYIDSSGLAALVANLRTAKARHASLRVTGTNLRTKRLFDVTGLTKIFALPGNSIRNGVA